MLPQLLNNPPGGVLKCPWPGMAWGLAPAPIFGRGPGPGALQHTPGRFIEQL